jgi:hypothetical protein
MRIRAFTGRRNAIQEMEMKDLFNTLALAMLRAARRRAELVAHMQTRARTNAGTDYRSNAGGWN